LAQECLRAAPLIPRIEVRRVRKAEAGEIHGVQTETSKRSHERGPHRSWKTYSIQQKHIGPVAAGEHVHTVIPRREAHEPRGHSHSVPVEHPPLSFDEALPRTLHDASATVA